MRNVKYIILLPALAVAAAVNPDPTFDASTSKGDFGPDGNGFTPDRVPAASATGAPKTVSSADAKTLQSACDSWAADTGTVSNFLDKGKATAAGQKFNDLANGAFAAEVDELVHKAMLDTIIGNDPQVSIANLTLTNGVFQSVVNNLQIMSLQSKASSQNLIDQINAVRCTQILPSIDTYMAVAARVIGQGATLRTAIRPAACASVLMQVGNNASAFPNVPNVPGGTPLGQQKPASGTSAGGRSGSGTRGSGAGAASSASSVTAPASTSATGGRAGKEGRPGSQSNAAAMATSVKGGSNGAGDAGTSVSATKGSGTTGSGPTATRAPSVGSGPAASTSSTPAAGSRAGKTGGTAGKTGRKTDAVKRTFRA